MKWRAATHSHVPNVFPKPEDAFPGVAEFNKIMASSSNKVRLQKLVKEHMKTHVSSLRGSIIYCETEMSNNLSTSAASTDFGFKHPEANNAAICLCQAKNTELQRTSCSRQRGHRRVRASSISLAPNTRESADQTQEWVHQFFHNAV